MKSFLFYMICLLPVALTAQPCATSVELTGRATINYGLQIKSTNPVVYEAYLITAGNGCRFVGSSQFSLVLPATTNITMLNGNAGSVFNTPWSFNSTVVSNGAKYVAAATAGSGQRIKFTAGQKMPLFTFSLSTSCANGLRIFRNNTDASGPADPGDVQGGDFSNSFWLAANPSPALAGREAYFKNESFTTNCPSASGTLPLTLTHFEANAIGKNEVSLTWQTLNELHVKSFVAERSFTPNGNNWQVAGTLAAAGTNSSSRNYQLTDKTPLTGTNYYRLRAIDIDGKETMSTVKLVTFKDAGSIKIYPNFIEKGGSVKIISNEILRYRVLDYTGKTVSAGTLTAGTATLSLNINAGSYMLETISPDKSSQHFKIIVQ